MKKIFLLLLGTLSFISFAGCGGGNSQPDISQISREDYYNDMIKEVVNVAPKQFGLKLPDDKIVIYGIITEQNVANLFYFVSAAYASGETVDIVYGGNCYISMAEKDLSSGISELIFMNAKKYLKYYESDIKKYWKDSSPEELSKNLLMTTFIGHGSNQEIRDRTKEFIESSQNVINSLTEVDKDGALPDAGKIKIIFLTNKGKYSIEGTLEEIRSAEAGFDTIFKDRSRISDLVFRNFAPEKGA